MGKLLSILGILCLLNSFSGVSAGRPPVPVKETPLAECWDIDGWFICFDN